MAVNNATAEIEAPSRAQLHAALGRSASVWPGIISGLEERFSPLELQWRPSGLAFGRMCALRHKGLALAYLLPMAGQLLVGVALDERAYELAQASALREAIKKMLRDTPPAPDGRGIRFVVKNEADIGQVVILAECIMADARVGGLS
ncbi:hypothetical protein FHS83_002897 [Rhizomicrobium palustre]|uniref:DUF3788 domain-containing protein n=1 Tax=Rhizomicrobium palustre TaxID=189966 RepID=A0A846N249_9PROT|nr:hypothetical protein [Rhizomicrobium palustre]